MNRLRPHPNWYAVFVILINFLFGSWLSALPMIQPYRDMLFLCLISLSTALLFYFQKGKRGLLQIVLLYRRPIPKRKMIPVALLGIGVWGISHLLNSLAAVGLQRLQFPQTPQLSEPESFAAGAGNFLLVLFVAPLLEEFLYRGLLQNVYKEKSEWLGILAPALLFALNHNNPYLFMLPLIYGFTAGYAVAVSKNIYIGMFIHFICNFLSFLLNGTEITESALFWLLVCASLTTVPALLLLRPWKRLKKEKIRTILKNYAYNIPFLLILIWSAVLWILLR